MRITLELMANGTGEPTKREIQKNIDAVNRAMKGESNCSDFSPLLSVSGILETIKSQLPQ